MQSATARIRTVCLLCQASRLPLCGNIAPRRRARLISTSPSATDHGPAKALSPKSPEPAQKPAESKENIGDAPSPPETESEPGRMTARLDDLASQAIAESTPRSAAKTLSEAGFSSELAAQLSDRITQASYSADNAQAISIANLPRGAGREVEATASARPWDGMETTEDAVLRMLNDKHKPLKPGLGRRSRPPVGQPINPDAGRRAPKQSSGQRLARARDQSSSYALARESSLSNAEREKVRAELAERFEPGARAMPNSIKGLQSLANERIEDAIGRGLFKNLPRGKAVERDHNASSPFIDTTEYLLNRLVQRQDIVPPWIEKQQQISRDVDAFRKRLRTEWKRHAARTISAQGGTLAEKMRKAEEYARAEKAWNPKPQPKDGGLRKGTIEALATTDADEAEEAIEKLVEDLLSPTAPSVSSTSTPPSVSEGEEAAPTDSAPLPSAPGPLFRDPAWQASERSYHQLSVDALNSLTRSYNLMAPDLAKKPYFSLDRELSAMFRDVAPLVAGEIHASATRPQLKSGSGLDRAMEGRGGFAEKFALDKGRVHDEVKPRYGFKEFWRDLFDNGKAEERKL